MAVTSPRSERREIAFRERQALCTVIQRQWAHRHDSEGKRKMLRAAIRMVRAC